MAFAKGSIILDGIDLNDSLQWTDRYSWQPVAQSVARTLQGGLVVYSQSLNEGRPVTLVATQETGWFEYGMVTAIQAIASVAGASYTLDYYGEIYTVRFDHSNPPAVIFQPLQPQSPSNYGATTDYFIGTVKLYTV